ncbi:MAG: hypothetical protein OXE17_16240 [Chloroflexi bacterium]|nr:hypothetical protein [Chloroflexota bacterium]
MAASNPDPVSSPGPVGDWEKLGRRIFSRSAAKDAAKNRIPFHLFLEKEDVNELSVDRLTVADAEHDGLPEVVADAKEVAANRPDPPNTFCGWAVVNAEATRGNSCVVHDTPKPGNRFHADIILPDAAMENRDTQKGHATTLAGLSKWRPYPPQPQDNAG